mmetsp:Transcript_385/g.996  ORF Transcript_385/g.996 Transcript_385/m.996 type:complete len:285 (-) Transcript_385:792-1646(-)
MHKHAATRAPACPPLQLISARPWPACSHIEALGHPLLLLVEHLLLGLLEVAVRDLHPPLTEREEPRLRAHGLNVRTAQLVLGHHELLEVDVLREGHAPRMDVEDAALRLHVGEGELDLAVDAAGAQQRGVEGLDPVGGHDHLDVAPRVEPIHLVEQLEHCALDLALAAALAVVALGAHGVDLVDEHDRRGELIRDPEELPHQLGAIPKVLLDELAPHHAEECRAGGVGHRLGQESLPRARLAVEDHALGGLDADVLIQLGMGEGQLHSLLNLLDLALEPTHICI